MSQILHLSSDEGAIKHHTSRGDVFAFDIDGTLTEPNEHIRKDDAMILSRLAQDAHILILSARDLDTIKNHILLHLPVDTNWNNYTLAGANGGQVARYDGTTYYEQRSIYELPQDFIDETVKNFEQIKHLHSIPDLHTDANIENRKSNLTIVIAPRYKVDKQGRTSKLSTLERSQADPDKKIRMTVILLLQKMSTHDIGAYEWMVAGATSIDIKSQTALKGHNLARMRNQGIIRGKNIVFFGDELTVGGDASIPKIVPDVTSIEVLSPKETYTILRLSFPHLSHETN